MFQDTPAWAGRQAGILLGTPKMLQAAEEAGSRQQAWESLGIGLGWQAEGKGRWKQINGGRQVEIVLLLTKMLPKQTCSSIFSEEYFPSNFSIPE